MKAFALPSKFLLVVATSAWCGSGVVVDSLGVPLESVKVTRKSDGASTLTNAAGAWALTPPTGVQERSTKGGARDSHLLLVDRRLTYKASSAHQVDGRRISSPITNRQEGRAYAARTEAVVDSVVASGKGWMPAKAGYDPKSTKNVVSNLMDGSPGMARILGGFDTLGSTALASNPPHVVRVAGFWMDTVEVTQELFDSLMGFNPSFNSTCPKCPVERVTWFDALRFCNARSRAEGLPEAYNLTSPDSLLWSWNPRSPGFRLPTDAEWEYAARAGASTDWYWGKNISQPTVSKYAWYNLNSGGTSQPVGKLLPNAFGLRDISGNVSEWTWDWSSDLTSDSLLYHKGPAEVSERKVIRGGGFTGYEGDVSVIRRLPSLPTTTWLALGFRCARGVMP